MLVVRKATDRGHTNLGWLDSLHSFSFGGYMDPAHMGFRSLRVLNDDRVEPAKGFGAHGHRDMEILSYVLEGRLAHKDSMGEERTLGPNELGVMSAGNGVIHSEFNPSPNEPVHFLQIWLVPSGKDIAPSYQQLTYEPSEKRGKLRLMVAPEQQTDPPVASIHQDARMYAAVLNAGETVDHAIAPGRHAWVHCATGQIDVNGVTLDAGDGVAVSDEARLALRGSGARENELLLFDLA